MGTAIVVRTRGGTPVRVGVFVDVCVGAEGARAVKPLETPGPTPYDVDSDVTSQNDEFRLSRRRGFRVSVALGSL